MYGQEYPRALAQMVARRHASRMWNRELRRRTITPAMRAARMRRRSMMQEELDRIREERWYESPEVMRYETMATGWQVIPDGTLEYIDGDGHVLAMSRRDLHAGSMQRRAAADTDADTPDGNGDEGGDFYNDTDDDSDADYFQASPPPRKKPKTEEEIRQEILEAQEHIVDKDSGKVLHDVLEYLSQNHLPAEIRKQQALEASTASPPDTQPPLPIPPNALNVPQTTEKHHIEPPRLSPGAIAGIAIGSLIGAAVLVLLILYCAKRRKEGKHLAEAHDNDPSRGAHPSAPADPSKTIMTVPPGVGEGEATSLDRGRSPTSSVLTRASSAASSARTKIKEKVASLSSRSSSTSSTAPRRPPPPPAQDSDFTGIFPPTHSNFEWRSPPSYAAEFAAPAASRRHSVTLAVAPSPGAQVGPNGVVYVGSPGGADEGVPPPLPPKTPGVAVAADEGALWRPRPRSMYPVELKREREMRGEAEGGMMRMEFEDEMRELVESESYEVGVVAGTAKGEGGIKGKIGSMLKGKGKAA